MTSTNYILLEKMFIKDFQYVIIKSIKKHICKLKPRYIYVYWFDKVIDRQCGCKYKDVYKLDKGNIINVSSNRLIECNIHSYIYSNPDITMTNIMERNQAPIYRRYTNYALEY